LPEVLRAIRELRVEQILDWTPLRIELFCTLAGRLEREGAQVRVCLPYFAERPQLADEALGAALKEFESRGAAGRRPSWSWMRLRPRPRSCPGSRGCS